MRIERTATSAWEGNLARGAGALTAGTGAFAGLAYRNATRIGRGDEGETSPEELVAAAHAGCFAMSLAAELSKAGTPPERLEVQATCVMDEREGNHVVVASQLRVRAAVPDLDAEGLRVAVDDADRGCPISYLIRGTADVEISAQLV